MPPAKTKTAKQREDGPPAVAGALTPAGAAEVLTLAETAAYLRVSEPEVLQMVRTQGLPCRQIGDGWRFLKTAVQSWLSAGPAKKGLLSQLGAIKDDPYAEEMLKEIYQRRGRPETEGD